MHDDVLHRDTQEHAYYLYLKRKKKGLPSDPVADWYEAEKDMRLAHEQAYEVAERVFFQRSGHYPEYFRERSFLDEAFRIIMRARFSAVHAN